MNKASTKNYLKEIFEKYNRKVFIEKDPVKYVHAFSKEEDKEIIGLISSAISLGKIELIFRAMDKIISIVGESPYESIKNGKNFKLLFKDFKYRFFSSEDMGNFFESLESALKKHGRLKNIFLKNWQKTKNLKTALHDFVSEINFSNSPLLPDPYKGSSCKRLNMFLRWMVRKDDVDIGLWQEIPTSSLIIPLDTHVSKISRVLGFTNRKSDDWKTAEEITNALKEFEPSDPLKYDFALCRAGVERYLPFKR
ncbi:MAG: TIGR02757 family protein [Candidatus Aminicenantia bacterium]